MNDTASLAPKNIDILRHSAAHLMARAVMRLYPNVQLAFGPAVENGFYYDFLMEHRLTEEDFPKIEAEMKALIKLNEEFERIELSMEEAIELLNGIGQTLKVEHLEELAGETTDDRRQTTGKNSGGVAASDTLPSAVCRLPSSTAKGSFSTSAEVRILKSRRKSVRSN